MWGQGEVQKFAEKHSLGELAKADLKKLFDGVITKSRRRVTVRVPATTANMGPGFDCAGMALDVWNELTVERASSFSIEIEGEGAQMLPRDKSNLVVKGVEAAYKYAEQEVPTLRYLTLNRIPFAKGMGSSSAAIVSGILAGLALAGFNLQVKNEEELLQIATNIEGHPDNVAPCIYGGFQLGIHNGKRWWTDRVTMPHGIMCVVFCPDHATETSEARQVLKEQIALQDAIFNCGRVAVLVAAFATGNMEWLRYGTEDALHQEQRAPIHPHLKPLIRAALDAGAHGACLSGAGPAVIAFTSGRCGDVIAQNASEREEFNVAEAFLSAADAIGCPGHVLITKPVEHGGYIVSETQVTDPDNRKNRIHYVQD